MCSKGRCGLGAQWFQFYHNAAIWVVSCFRFVSFVVGPGCAIKNLEGCLFGFGWKAVHSNDVVGIVLCVCCQ